MIISIESIEPEVVLSTIVDCVVISFDSIIKSLSAYWSDTLYGYVFLTKSLLLKSNVFWFTLKFSVTGLDLKVFPIKYGNLGTREFVVIPAKYAYVPSGYSGVLQYLPLCLSKSPELLNL